MDAADFEKYLDLVAMEGAWGGGLEITALSNTLNMCSRVFTGDGTFVFNPNGQKGTLTIRFCDKHFEALKGQIRREADWGTIKEGPRALPTKISLLLPIRALNRLPLVLGLGLPPTRCSAQPLLIFVESRQGTANGRNPASGRSRSQQISSSSKPKQDAFGQQRPYHWICDVCKQEISGTTIRQISKLRAGHMRAHPNVPRDRFHKIRTTPEVVTAMSPGSFRQEPSWECSWCGYVLPALNTISLRASSKAHWKLCEGKPRGATLGKNFRRLLEKRGIRIRGHTKGSLAGAARFAAIDKIQQYNASNANNPEAHDLVAVYHGDKNRRYMPTCRRCTIYWLNSKNLFQQQRHQKCHGLLKRQQLFNSSGRRITWKQATLARKRQLSKVWKINYKAGAQRLQL